MRRGIRRPGWSARRPIRRTAPCSRQLVGGKRGAQLRFVVIQPRVVAAEHGILHRPVGRAQRRKAVLLCSGSGSRAGAAPRSATAGAGPDSRRCPAHVIGAEALISWPIITRTPADRRSLLCAKQLADIGIDVLDPELGRDVARSVTHSIRPVRFEIGAQASSTLPPPAKR